MTGAGTLLRFGGLGALIAFGTVNRFDFTLEQ
jgi:hypothetical protein